MESMSIKKLSYLNVRDHFKLVIKTYFESDKKNKNNKKAALAIVEPA